MEPNIQYAQTRDGLSIAYWAMGAGEPPLIMGPQLGWSHISLELQSPALADWYRHLASRHTVVRYDPRGQGLSDRDVEQISEDDLAGDIEAVIEHLGAPQVDLLGCYGLGPPMVRVAAEHSNEVRRLVLGNPILMGDRHYGSERIQALRKLIDSDWDLFTRAFAHEGVGWSGSGAQDAEAWAAYIRRAVRPRDAALVLDALASIDWRRWLPKVRVPTLVFVDAATAHAPQASEVRWSDIADVRVRPIDMREHRLLYQSEAARAVVDDFLSQDGERATPGERRSLRTGTAVILFADIAGSTQLTEQLGDHEFRQRQRALDAVLRTIIAEESGAAVPGRTLGDGVLAEFTSARSAINAAVRCANAGNERGLALHLGIHAGDLIREDDNAYGGAVNIAARICDASTAGEILVSDVVRTLARTSAGVRFEDRGEVLLKGIEEPQRLFAVRPPG